MTILSQSTTQKYWTYALWLALFTVFYNLAEGWVSILFGLSDETLTLFGFGVDSFIEVLSGIGILAMVLRIRQNPATSRSLRSQFERTALRVTGMSFYLLAIGLGLTAMYNLFTAHKPATTLNSSPILADANCTLVCIYMSVVLLASSLIYQLTGLAFIDSIGALGLIYFSYNEGKESFEKAASMDDCFQAKSDETANPGQK
jgi:divalent metal cation (Fe/Co/Zn/Cd) transporter